MEVPRSERRPASRSLLFVIAVHAALTVLAILVIDQPVARWIWQYEPAGFWNRGIDYLEWAIGLPVFSWISGIVLVLGMVITAAVPRWRGQTPVWMLVAATHIISRYLTLQLKLGTARLRPTEWLEQGGDTFGREGGVSFPSGHVAIFGSIVIPLAVAVPRLRPLIAIVGFVMAARVAVDAHFISDVTASVTLIGLVTYALSWLIRPLPAPARTP